MKSITTSILLLIGLTASAQFLNFNKKEIVSTLGDTYYVSTISIDGNAIISVPNVSGCICTYIFDKNDICKQETIYSSNESVVDLIMGLERDYYIKIGDVYWLEQPYGLVEVKRTGDTFIFACK